MSCPGQATEHDADHGEANEGLGGSSIALEVARETAIMADPCEGSLNDPSFGQDDEAVQVVALDDFELPGAGLCDGGGGLGSLVAAIGEDALDEGEETARASIENQRRPVAVLHIGRMNDDVQQEAERIDEDVPLAARDLLARIEPLRVKRGAPF